MEETFPATVTVDFFFEGFEVGEQVAVGDDDTARFGRGAGGEDNFYRIGALNRRGGKCVDRLGLWRGMQAFEFDDGDAEIVRGCAGEFTADCGCAYTGLARDAGCKFRVGDGVHRDGLTRARREADGFSACEQHDSPSRRLAAKCAHGRSEFRNVFFKQTAHDLVHPRIDFVIGSSISETVLDEMKAAVARAEGPVMVVLDSDHRREHVAAELELYAPLVTSGSLMLAQDGIVDAHRIFTGGRPGPGPAIAEFLVRHREFYVDESQDRRFLATHHPRGWLRRH